MTELSHDEWLKLIFSNTGSPAFCNAPQEPNRPVLQDPPDPNTQIAVVEYGYLCDPNWEPEELPTCREYWDFDGLPPEKQAERLMETAGYDESLLEQEFDIVKPINGWDAEIIAELEVLLGHHLDEPIDPEYISPHDRLHSGPYAIGAYLLLELPEEEQERLGLWVMEGDQPGSDFCGVRFDGDVAELNRALKENGINLFVQDSV